MSLKKQNHKSTSYISHFGLVKSHIAFLLLRHLGGSVSKSLQFQCVQFYRTLEV